MSLDKNQQYVHRVGSDNQYRLFWNGTAWCYEFYAGGVLFDEQKFSTEQEMEQGISFHGLTLDQFLVDSSGEAQKYSDKMKQKQKELLAAGLSPCPKHGLSAKNMDNTCEACDNMDYPDDFKGTEG